MIVREAIQEVRGFRYMVEHLDLRSGLGRRVFYDQPWMTDSREIEEELGRVEKVAGILRAAGREADNVSVRLEQVKDIRGTVARVKEGVVLDDLELFELKNLALNGGLLREAVEAWGVVSIPDLEGVVRLLDPEGLRIPHFYICDAFSEELAALRAEMKRCKQWGEEDAAERLYAQSVEWEDRVRGQLSKDLRGFAGILGQALQEIARLDILLAKARQALALGLAKPVCGGEATVFEGLFHPQLRELLQRQGKRFQPVDLCLCAGATLVTGANMAGKTVLLKSVAVAQCLLQFGCYVPAARAEMAVVDDLMASIGDEQDELHGLSSFAAEMLRIHRMVSRVKAGERLLVLIDELARTTNPLEGRAIVDAVVEFLTEHKTMALVTTHYSGITAACRKLRVRGFVEGQGKVTWKNINEFMDYSLEEDEGGTVPHEALQIAALLGVDRDLLARAERFAGQTE